MKEEKQKSESELSESKKVEASIGACVDFLTREFCPNHLVPAKDTNLDAEKTDDLVDLVLVLDSFDKAVKETMKVFGSIQARVEKVVVDRFVEMEQGSVKRSGKLIYLAEENWPGPRIDNLLPEGVTENMSDNEQYAKTFAVVRESAKDRLIQALKSSPKFRHLVAENYNLQSLRSALVGKEAEKDELDRPVVPGELVEAVKFTKQTCLRIRKA